MELEKSRRSGLGKTSFCLFLLLVISSSASVEAYQNYTVGDSLGWYDKQMKPSVDYQKWADGKNFTLGDFLLFNTDTNHSVVQTYNFTTYKLCDSDNAQESDTTEWSEGNPSSTNPQPVTVAVPLVKEGMNYFFSGDYDGDQCKYGQQYFKIKVTYGQGLPPALKTPSPSGDQSGSPAAAPDSGGDQMVPDLVAPSSFNNPRNITTADNDDDTAESQSNSSVFSSSPLRFENALILFSIIFSLFKSIIQG
ncbi:hypothetical protein NMG60_11015488 [Bertholletia excelsa]